MKATSNLFGDISFFGYSANRLANVKAEIMAEKPDYILNVNETEYLAHLEAQYALEPIVFDVAGMTMEVEERQVGANRFPPGFAVRPGASYSKQAFSFHVP